MTSTTAKEEAGEITYGAAGTRIGATDEDHRTMYGVIIKNPKSNSASEKVMLQIPPNQVYANVSIKGKVIAHVELNPSLLAILTDMESLVNKIRTTTEYSRQPVLIERALKIIEKQIQTLKKISSTINAQPQKSSRKK